MIIFVIGFNITFSKPKRHKEFPISKSNRVYLQNMFLSKVYSDLVKQVIEVIGYEKSNLKL